MCINHTFMSSQIDYISDYIVPINTEQNEPMLNENISTDTSTSTNTQDEIICTDIPQCEAPTIFTNSIDRRIGNYLLDELDKKNQYIDELEDLIKFQQNEINELKARLNSVNQLELINKIKSNLEAKTQSQPQPQPQSVVNDANPIKKSKTSNSDSDNEITPFVPLNQDLTHSTSTYSKVKPMSKEDEELNVRYKGITIIPKPVVELVPKPVISDTDISQSELSKQRRRARKL